MRLSYERVTLGHRIAAGLFVLVSGALALGLGRDQPLAAMVPLAAFLVALCGLFARYTITVDGAARAVEESIGLCLPILTIRRHPATSWRCVTMRLVAIYTGNSTSLSYGVFLVGASRERLLEQVADLAQARATAEAVAKLLGLGVSDEITQSGYREAGSLDEPLRQRLLRVPSLPPLGRPPSRLSIEVVRDELRVRLPRARALPQLTLALSWCSFGAICCVPIFIVVSGLGHPGATRDVVMRAVSLLGLVPAVVAAVVSWRELRELEREVLVFVSPRALGAEIQGPLGRRCLAVSAERLENVGVGHRVRLGWFPRRGPPRLVACADDEVVSFGTSCSPEEHAWLIRAIHCYLRGT